MLTLISPPAHGGPYPAAESTALCSCFSAHSKREMEAGSGLRRRMRRGKPPEPQALLDGLESLWALPLEASRGRPFGLRGAYRRAKRTFAYALRGHEDGRRMLGDLTAALDSFVESWQPSTVAHNDFYDDQMLVLPDGRVALVDFEETGPGDPLLEVGNLLAHLRWTSRLGRTRKTDASGAYHHAFREAAIERFRWSEEDLALREAVQTRGEEGNRYDSRKDEQGSRPRHRVHHPQAGRPRQECAEMTYTVVIEKTGNGYSAYVPNLPGCAAAGHTREETEAVIQEAVTYHLEMLRESGDPIPELHTTSSLVTV